MGDHNRMAKDITAGKGFHYLGRGGAIGAVAGNKLGKGRGDETGCLIGLPVAAINHLCAGVGTGPSQHLLPAK